MQAQLPKKNKKLRVRSPKEQRLRIAQLLREESKRIKVYSGSSSSTNNNKEASDQPKSSTSITYVSSNDQQNEANRTKNKIKKPCRILTSKRPHAICLNHMTTHPYCSIEAKEMFSIYPMYYSVKHRYVLSWLRKHFDSTTAKPIIPSSGEDSDSDSDSDSTSSDIDTSSESTTKKDIETKPKKKRQRSHTESSGSSSTESSSDITSKTD